MGENWSRKSFSLLWAISRGWWVGVLDSYNWCMSEGIRPSTQGELGCASGCCECSPHWWALGGDWALEKQQQLFLGLAWLPPERAVSTLSIRLTTKPLAVNFSWRSAPWTKHWLFAWLFHIISSLGLWQVSCSLLLFLCVNFMRVAEWRNEKACPLPCRTADDPSGEVCACVHAWMGYMCVVC